MVKQLTLIQKLKSLVIVSVGGAGVCTGLSIYNESEHVYKKIIMPVTHLLNPEIAHRVGVLTCKYGLLPKSRFQDPDTLVINHLRTTFCGKTMSNPLGMAAGFDKHGEAVAGLNHLGFAFVEVGTVTPEPQTGNAKPRVYRLPEDGAIVNRYGFNSDGHKIVHSRLEKLRDDYDYDGVIGVNLGKNKLSLDADDDYVRGIYEFINVADYFVVNISSPNTPGLRDLQKNSEHLSKLLSAVISARDSFPNKPPVFLKLSPDLSTEEKENIASVLRKNECKVDGIIVCNTTSTRNEHLKSINARETGGLSGAPIKDKSTKMISEMYRLTNGMTIIGVGGISSGQDAYDKIKAGAKYIQLYTSFVYEGPLCATKIKRELHELLEKDGYRNYSEAIGKDVKRTQNVNVIV